MVFRTAVNSNNEVTGGTLAMEENSMNQERKVIGVCGSRIFNQIPMQFINALRKAGTRNDYYIIAFSSYAYSGEESDETIGEEQLFELTKFIDFSGLIILSETLKNPRLVKTIVDIGTRRDIPVFSVGGVVEGCYNLVLDYHDGFELMVRHIVEEHGCRKVNMMAGFRDNELSDERISVYKKVLQDNGLPFEENRLAYGDFWDRPTRKAVLKFLDDEAGLPEAIVCANDSMAITVCSVLHEKGYRVPEDIIVTGFDGTRDGEYHFPKISTCAPDYESAVAFILREIKSVWNQNSVNPCDYTIKFSLNKSESCGCRKKIVSDVNTVISSLAMDVGDCTWHNIAMNNMVNSVLDANNIMDIAKQIPEYINLWSDTFRFACLKSDLIHSHELTDDCTEMTTILWEYKEEFKEPGETFPVSEFMPGLDKIFKKGSDFDTLVVRLLNSGKKVYGYTVEGMQDLNDRRLQRCNEFAMFLTFSIDTVLHNFQMKKMNENLFRAYDKISKLYILDHMTGIYNRRGFSQKMEELLAGHENIGKYLYLFSIDMDGLKYINDTFGHSEGDFAITTLSKAIANTAEKDAIYARFGGDEFTCGIIAEEQQKYSAEGFSKQLMENVALISGVSTKPYSITASVGMEAQQIVENMDIEGLLQKADRLMYADKAARKKQRVT